MLWRLLSSWCVLSGLAAWALPLRSTPPLEVLLAAGTLSGMLACSSARSTALLRAAAGGQLRISDDGIRFSVWRGALPALALGTVLGALVSFALWASLSSFTPLLGFLFFFTTTSAAAVCGIALGRRDRAVTWRRRETTLAAWVWRDTAMPAGLFAAGFAAVLTALRFPAGLVAADEAARHAAVTALLYGVLLGLPAAMKTAREARAGLVHAVTSHPVQLSPIAFSGTVGLAALVVVPRVLEAVDATSFVMAKGALGLVTGTAAAAVGALRGATWLNRTT